MVESYLKQKTTYFKQFTNYGLEFAQIFKKIVTSPLSYRIFFLIMASTLLGVSSLAIVPTIIFAWSVAAVTLATAIDVHFYRKKYKLIEKHKKLREIIKSKGREKRLGHKCLNLSDDFSSNLSGQERLAHLRNFLQRIFDYSLLTVSSMLSCNLFALTKVISYASLDSDAEYKTAKEYFKTINHIEREINVMENDISKHKNTYKDIKDKNDDQAKIPGALQVFCDCFLALNPLNKMNDDMQYQPLYEFSKKSTENRSQKKESKIKAEVTTHNIAQNNRKKIHPIARDSQNHTERIRARREEGSHEKQWQLQ